MSITAEQVTEGMQVSFRPDFSKHLVGMVFEIDDRLGDSLVRTAHENNEVCQYVALRIRLGRKWNYRQAYLSDLIPA